jgi:pimeloyl-ACP methyl ester carboxylesterase
MDRKLILSTLPLICLSILLLVLAQGCGSDPFERPGSYAVYGSGDVVIPNPEEPSAPIHAKIFAPSTDGGASIAEGSFELVVLMPGFGASIDLYEMYARHLASHGSIVIGMDFVQTIGFDGNHDYLARQTTYVIDYAVNNKCPLKGHVDTSKIATAGHSQGGKIAFYAAAIDHRISVVMAMDPSNGGGPPCFISDEWCNAYPVAPNVETGAVGLLDSVDAASFIMRAAPDPLNPDYQSNAEHFFYGLDGLGTHGVKTPALYFDMGESGHASWLFLGKNLNVPRITARTMVAWLKTYFHGQCLEDYFTGEVVQEDIDAGYIVAVDTR